MATTFSTTFTNALINCLTGRSASSQISYLQFYDGAQPADPSAAPAGTPVFSSYGNSINLSGYMTLPTMGVANMSVQRSAAASTTVASLTFARLMNSSGGGLVDTKASLAGGGGGVIVPTLNSTSGVAFVASEFSVKLPLSNGSVMLNTTLVNALVAAVAVSAATVGAGASASINIYTGAAPASADLPATGTLLATFTTAASGASWNAASGGAASLASTLSVAASATGTAGYARLEKGAYVLQGSVGISGADLILDSVSLTSGTTTQLTSATISL